VAERIRIFFKERDAGYVGSILSGQIKLEPGTGVEGVLRKKLEPQPGKKPLAESEKQKIEAQIRSVRSARIKIEATPVDFSPKPFEKGIMHAAVEAGHLAKLRKMEVALGKIGPSGGAVNITGHPAHENIFIGPAGGYADEGSRRVKLEPVGEKSEEFVSRAFKTYEESGKIKALEKAGEGREKPLLVLYSTHAAKKKKR